jgi:hypothetical protein
MTLETNFLHDIFDRGRFPTIQKYFRIQDPVKELTEINSIKVGISSKNDIYLEHIDEDRVNYVINGNFYIIPKEWNLIKKDVELLDAHNNEQVSYYLHRYNDFFIHISYFRYIEEENEKMSVTLNIYNKTNKRKFISATTYNLSGHQIPSLEGIYDIHIKPLLVELFDNTILPLEYIDYLPKDSIPPYFKVVERQSTFLSELKNYLVPYKYKDEIYWKKFYSSTLLMTDDFQYIIQPNIDTEDDIWVDESSMGINLYKICNKFYVVYNEFTKKIILQYINDCNIYLEDITPHFNHITFETRTMDNICCIIKKIIETKLVKINNGKYFAIKEKS